MLDKRMPGELIGGPVQTVSPCGTAVIAISIGGMPRGEARPGVSDSS